MDPDNSPFFVAPHRFDEPAEPGRPELDRRHNLLLEEGERVLWQGYAQVSGYLLGPTNVHRSWALTPLTTVTVTDRRLAYVCARWRPTLVGVARSARHRRRTDAGANLVTGELRWQWPSRLELLSGGPDEPQQVLLVCDALRTIQQPALAVDVAGQSGPTAPELARLVRRAVAGFRLANPHMVDLSPAEQAVLTVRAGTDPVGVKDEQLVTLPGALPVEFLDQTDYHRQWSDQPLTNGGRHHRSDNDAFLSRASFSPGSAC